MEHCFYAFIDLSTKKQLRDDGYITDERKVKGWLPRSGIWRLVLLADKKPFETPR